MFMNILRAGSSTAMKVFKIYRPLRVVGIVFAIAVLILLAWLGWTYRHSALLTVEGVGIFFLSLAVATLFGKLVMQIVWFRQTLLKIAFGVGMAFFGFLVARLHLHVFNPLYLRLGSLRNLRAAE